ncbi:unnamed protein product [Knipowitschia caucasica]|uniref:PSI domain-containing protein n=1 Tax=Knipowitschia caucasica TaxID=637954 RepID=A0AAV2JUR7_KNICA
MTSHMFMGCIIVSSFQVRHGQPARASEGPPTPWTHWDLTGDLLQEENHTSTQIIDVDHVYYTSKIFSPSDAELWVNFTQETWKNLSSLPKLQRQVQRVYLSFEFPFYGHLLKAVTVASGGFIYTGEMMHQPLTSTQYIAPLMADFDPSLSHDSFVFYGDNGTALVVQWSHLYLQDNSRLGPFTFQVALHQDGRILFTYKQVPVDVSLISTEHHPVRVGLSDAFVVQHQIEQIPNVRRKTFYEYHKVDILKSSVSSHTGVEMFPLPTCLQFSSCGSCVSSQIGFNCSWCSRLQRCSSGFDRSRQDWVDHGCLDEKRDPRCVQAPGPSEALPSTQSTTPVLSAATEDPHSGQGAANTSLNSMVMRGAAAKQSTAEGLEVPGNVQVGLVVGVAVGTVAVTTAVLLAVYIYMHPTSSLSLFFLERRPTQWPILRFRRGSGRPSYAEVEHAGLDQDTSVVIDPKQVFIISDRRESEQKEGFVVSDQRERFLSDKC